MTPYILILNINLLCNKFCVTHKGKFEKLKLSTRLDKMLSTAIDRPQIDQTFSSRNAHLCEFAQTCPCWVWSIPDICLQSAYHCRTAHELRYNSS